MQEISSYFSSHFSRGWYLLRSGRESPSGLFLEIQSVHGLPHCWKMSSTMVFEFPGAIHPLPSYAVRCLRTPEDYVFRYADTKLKDQRNTR